MSEINIVRNFLQVICKANQVTRYVMTESSGKKNRHVTIDGISPSSNPVSDPGSKFPLLLLREILGSNEFVVKKAALLLVWHGRL